MWLFVIIICSVIFLLVSRKSKRSLPSIKKDDASSSLWIFEVTDREQCKLACSLIKDHCKSLNALGFDCEWICWNGKQRPVALVQTATVYGFCCLFRLNVLGTIPNELREILEDPEILKLGISPLNDSQLLKKDYNIQACSTLDLRYLYPRNKGLASMAASVLNIELDKSYSLQCSNWESPKLTESQREYAAKDAFVAIEIFKCWLLSKTNFYNIDNPDVYSQLLKEVKFEVYRYLDVTFKPNHSLPQSNSRASTLNQEKLKSGYVARKTPLYHNCFMHAPDGQLLCSCDKRKAQWYIDRGLAKVLPGEPYSIKLLFEPEARASKSNEGRFYQQLKQNRCVVCGDLQSYLKHNVVPKEYRKHFPNVMKDHQSHDIVLMCIRCHQLAVKHNELLRQKLAVLCNAPIKIPIVSQVRMIQKVKKSAKALLVAGDTIPKERKAILENEVKKYSKSNLIREVLEECTNLESKIINENYKCHGINVVNYFIENGGGLAKLEILWRKYFLETMKPQYLPALWSITHNHSRLSTEIKSKSEF